MVSDLFLRLLVRPGATRKKEFAESAAAAGWPAGVKKK
jgi:hypothetical protein